MCVHVGWGCGEALRPWGAGSRVSASPVAWASGERCQRPHAPAGGLSVSSGVTVPPECWIGSPGVAVSETPRGAPLQGPCTMQSPS